MIIVSVDDGHICVPGETGEVCFQSKSVTKGYWQQPAATLETFDFHPKDEDGSAFLRTGDLGFLDADGRLYITGRLKDLIIIHGVNHYPQDIELTVSHSHRLIRQDQCAAFSVTENDEEHLVLVLEINSSNIAEDGPDIADSVRFHVSINDEVSVYRVVMIPPKTLPKTTSGKVRRKDTRKFLLEGKLNILYESKTTDQSFNSVHKKIVSPVTETERLICGYLSQYFGHEVGCLDNFLELGGDSLSAAQLAGYLESSCRVSVSPGIIFEKLTPKILASYIDTLEILPARGAGSLSGDGVEDRITGEFPLSDGQERLFNIDLVNNRSNFYNLALQIDFKGNLNLDVFNHALNALIARQTALRSSFHQGFDGASQIIRNDIIIRPEIIQSSSRDETDGLIKNFTHQVFDLTRGDLLKILVIQADSDTYHAVVLTHHIVADGWSSTVFCEELSLLYNAEVNGTPPALPPLRYHYENFCKEDRSAESRALKLKNAGYWCQKLKDIPAQIDLPLDRKRPVFSTYSGDAVHLTLPYHTQNALKRLARKRGVSLYMVLLSAFSLLLSRYCNQRQLIIGTAAADRRAPERQNLIGYFVDTLPLGFDIDPDQPFQDYIVMIKNMVLDALHHQNVNLNEILSGLHIPRSSGVSSLIQVMFSLQNYRSRLIEFEGMKTSVTPLRIMSVFDLSLDCEENSHGLSCHFQYSTDIFERKTISQMSENFLTILENIIKNPSQPVSQTEILTVDEKRKILVDWNSTERDYPSVTTIHRLFEDQVKKTPGNTAVVFEGKELSYCMLNEKANQLAHYLIKQGLKPGALAAICAERSLELIVGLLGILKAGAAFVPLDPGDPPERLQFILIDCQVPFLITTELSEINFSETGFLQKINMDSARAGILKQRKNNPRLDTSAKSYAYVIYTSGSTGQPKGVPVSHRQLSNLVSWMRTDFQINSEDRCGQYLSIGFDASISEIIPPLLSGASVYIVPEHVKRDVDLLNNYLNDNNISLCSLPAPIFELFSKTKNRSLKRLLVGGDRLKYSGVLPYKVYNSYGPTETTVCISYYESSKIMQFPPIGRPVANTKLYILDSHLNPVPVGVIGELHAGGDQVSCGYINRPELTSEKFITNRFSDDRASLLYKTGDLCRWLPDGNIEYIGRIDQQVKIRGFRIEPGEIESNLLKHPSVKETVVLARGDTPNDKRLVAYVVLKETRSGSPDEYITALRDHLKILLPDYMMPHAFVLLEALPLTINGKLDRGALPAPEYQMSRNYQAPRSEAEHILADIWKKVLKLETVGVFDNFFEVGGDSILSIQIISRANKEGLHLKARDIFRFSTIAEQAAAVSDITHSVLPRQISGDVPLTPIQYYFFDQDNPQPSHWNQAVLLKLSPNFDRNALIQAIGRVWKAHPGLFMRYKKEGSVWRQFYTDSSFTVLFEKDVIDAGDKYASESALTALQASIDIVNGPLYRIAFVTGFLDQCERLFISIHHLVIDGVSWRFLLEEISDIYQRIIHHKKVTVHQEISSFKDWALQLESFSRSETLHAEQAYWLALPVTPSLPVDGRGVNTIADADHITVHLSARETKLLLSEVPYAYHTEINEILLTALLLSCRAWTGESQLTLHLEGHGREEFFDTVNISRTVGWFTALFPVYLNFPGGSPSMGELIMHVKEQYRSIPRKGIGYGVLRYLSPDDSIGRALAKRDSAQITFNYLGQIDAGLSETGLFEMSDGPIGQSVGLGNNRTDLIDINGAIVGDILSLTFGYSRNIHYKKTIYKLAELYREKLRELIRYCVEGEHFGFTPSDFPLVALTQETVNVLTDRNTQTIYPQTPMQQGMLFHTLYDREAGVYVNQLLVTLEGDLKHNLFKQAWEGLLQQYSMLRTRFVWESPGRPLQQVLKKIQLPWAFYDWRSFTHAEQKAKTEALLKQDRNERYDFTKAPLMRVTLLQMSDNTHLCLWSHHHILLDGWSMPIVLKQLLQNYTTLLQHRELPSVPQYVYQNYMAWLIKQNKEAANHYWRTLLGGFDTPTRLGIEKPAACTAPPVYGKKERHFSDELTQKARVFVRRYNLTLSTLMQGIWGLLVSRYNSSHDIIFGSTVSGRPAEISDIESEVGLFINTLPVRIRTEKKQTVLDFLQQLQEQLVSSRQYEQTALWEIQNLSELNGGAPLCGHLFVYENYPVDRFGMDDMPVKMVDIRSEEQTNFSLTVTGSETDGHLYLGLKYDENVYSADALTSLLDHYHRLLEAAIENPEQMSINLSMLTGMESHRILTEWNATDTDYPRDKTIHQLFEEQAEKTPDNTAAVSGDKKLSYRELNEKASQLAHYLIKQGVKPAALIAVCMERSPELIIVLLGILKAGAAYVPVDVDYPDARIQLILDDLQTPVLISSSVHCLRFSFYSGCKIFFDKIDDMPAAQPCKNIKSEIASSNPAYVIYTSGSTGVPKGVSVPHRAVSRLCLNQNFISISQSDVFGQASSIGFDAMTFEIWPALLNGASVSIFKKEDILSAVTFEKNIKKNRVTVMWLTSGLFNQLFQQNPKIFRSLRLLLIGGEALTADFVNKFAGDSENPELINGYGPTENTTFTACYKISKNSCLESIPVGRPVSNTKIYILDDNLQAVPVGVTGELHAGGDGLADGYLNQPGLTAEKFIKDPFSSDPLARLYKTGDLCRWLPDGNIEYIGRIDCQVKIRGFRIEPGEIESHLLKIPGVKEALVSVREDSSGDKRLVAYVVLNDGIVSNDIISVLKNELKRTIPGYMVPAAFVRLEKFPLTPNGKLDRKALPAPEYQAHSEKILPRNATEQGLADIWRDVLNLESPGVTDNFFESGGHSLLATQVISRLRTVSGVELPIRAIFESPTIAELAQQVQEAQKSQLPAIIPVPRDVPIPLSFAQQRLWFLDQLTPDTAEYNVAGAVRLQGLLDRQALKKAINALIARHEVLRTHFVSTDERVWQHIEPAEDRPLIEVDLKNAEPEKIQNLLQEKIEASFDLAVGPLLRVGLIGLSETEAVLWISMHHIISDGWSIGILLRELSEAYKAFRAGHAPAWTPLAVQYADYSVWQRACLLEGGALLTRQLAYWSHQLADIPAVLTLPTDRPRPAVRSLLGDHVDFVLEKQLSEKLTQLAEREHASLFMVLLAAFDLLLYRYTGQSDIVVGSPIAGRRHEATESLIGFFVNTLVLRTQVDGQSSFRTLLRHVREMTLSAYEHQDVPFEHLVEHLKVERSLSYSPLFQVMLILQNNRESEFCMEGLTITRAPIRSSVAKFDLTLSCTETDEGLACSVEYATTLFDRARIERLVNHWRCLLSALSDNPDQAVGRLSMLNSAEYKQIVYDWNATGREYPKNKTVHQLFEDQVKKNPDNIAVLFEEKKLSYRELNKKANQLAHYLIKQGVKPDTRVAICMERSLELMIGILGILKAGGAYVPLDPEYPKERLAFILQEICSPVLVTHKSLQKYLPDQPGAHLIFLDVEGKELSLEKSTDPVTCVSPDNLSYIIYTSGSTGIPKGVQIEHKTVVNLLFGLQEKFPLAECDTFLLKTNYTFDVSVVELFGWIFDGGRLSILRPHDEKDAEKIAMAIEKNNVTHINFVPSAMLSIVSLPSEYIVSQFRRLKYIFLAGEAVSPGLMESIRSLYIDSGETDIENIYGPTEGTVYTTYFNLEDKFSSFNVPIGKPLNNVQVYILDNNLNVVPVGVAGELHIGGAGLSRGYLNRPRLTAEKFITDSPGVDFSKKLYKTGDLCRWLPDGNIEYIGRIDHQVKIRGFRIELGEIEFNLLQNPSIKEAVVIAREDCSDDRRLVAYVILNGNSEAKDEAVSAFKKNLKRILPDYMIPAAFVILEKFPLTLNGKLDRKALPAPEYISREKYMAPGNELEIHLTRIWEEVLGLQNAGIQDNFFESGGNSLLAVQLTARINKLPQLKTVGIRDIFQKPTIREICESVESAENKNIQYVNLNQEAVLPEEITGKGMSPAKNGKILITGSTGFLGRYVLKNILDKTESSVICMVRSEDPIGAAKKVKDSMTKSKLWNDSYLNRLEFIVADMDMPHFGLSSEMYEKICREVHIIYHLATAMNHFSGYYQVKQANVDGLIEVIRLATTHTLKTIHYGSAISIFSTYNGQDEETSIDSQNHEISSGYSASKWVAEKISLLAVARGIPIKIYRLPLFVGDNDGNWNAEDQWLYQLFKNCYFLNKYFDQLENIRQHIACVDWVAETLVGLSLLSEIKNTVFHVFPEKSQSFDYFIQKEGLQKVSLPEWIHSLKKFYKNRDDNLHPTMVNILDQALKTGGSESGSPSDRSEVHMPEPAAVLLSDKTCNILKTIRISSSPGAVFSGKTFGIFP